MESISVGLSLGGVFVRSLQDRDRRPEAHPLSNMAGPETSNAG